MLIIYNLQIIIKTNSGENNLQRIIFIIEILSYISKVCMNQTRHL